MKNYSIGTLVIRNKRCSSWSHRRTYKPGYFTEVGEVIGINEYGDPEVRWSNGELYRYDDPEGQLIIVDLPKKWSLPDELFEI